MKDGISFPHITGSGVHPQPDILGRNGTLIGFRKLHTRVADFRRFLRENAASAAEEELLAAKLVGRWRRGAPLAPEQDDPALAEDCARNNDFSYADDPKGLLCPFGAHIRRNNPRDTQMPVLSDVYLHRTVRYGTTYGPPLRWLSEMHGP